jgi:hypothetical protein
MLMPAHNWVCGLPRRFGNFLLNLHHNGEANPMEKLIGIFNVGKELKAINQFSLRPHYFYKFPQ